VLVNHFVPYAVCHALFACVRMFLCLFLCIDRLISSLTSAEVVLFSYSFGGVLNVAFSCPRRNSEAIGPSILWRSIVNGSILWFLVTSSCASCSDVELDNFLYSCY